MGGKVAHCLILARNRVAAHPPPMTQVIVCDFEAGVVFTDDGTSLPITNWFDQFGDEVGSFEEASVFVAGAGSCWYAGKIADWKMVRVQ